MIAVAWTWWFLVGPAVLGQQDGAAPAGGAAAQVDESGAARPGSDSGFAWKDEERVLFFGSTAVWPASFGLQVETFVQVKYPLLKARFWHWGPPIPTLLADARKRLPDHLRAFHPTVAVLNFGVNEGESRAFNEERLNAFRTNLAEVVEQLRQAGVRVILVTPNYPEIARKDLLKKNAYDEVVARHAEVVRNLGTEQNLTVVDWFAITRDYAAAHPSETASGKGLTVDGIYPTELAHALAAEALLEALGAEPLEATVALDCSELSVAATAGSATATRKDESTIALELKDFPLPWVVPGRGWPTPRSWLPSRFCRMTLELQNAPSAPVSITALGAKASRWPTGSSGDSAEDDRGGGLKSRYVLDMADCGPVIAAKPLVALMQLVSKKDRAVDKYDLWTKQPFAEPEYAEANVKYNEAMTAEVEGTARIIDRSPRTMDLTLEITFGGAAPAKAGP